MRLAFGIYYLIGLLYVASRCPEAAGRALGVAVGMVIMATVWPIVVARKAWRKLNAWLDSVSVKHPM